MKRSVFHNSTVLLATVGSVSSILALYQLRPWLCYSAIILIAGWIVGLYLWSQNRTMNMINKGVIAAQKKLTNDNFAPDIVIAFTRTSAVFAGILSVRLGVPSLLVIHRTPKSDPVSKAQLWDIGGGMTLDANAFAGKRILLVAYVLETGRSIDSGIYFLVSQGLTRDSMKIVSLYSTPAAHKMLPDAIVINETTEDVLSGLPWLDGPYARP